MWATYLDALQEAGGRWVVVTLTGLAAVIGGLFSLSVSFGYALNGVKVIYQGPLSMGPWALAVPVILGQLTVFTGNIWLLLMIFAGCPQFVSMLEKGWRDLTFSKATPRWQIMLARYLSICTLFFLLVVVSDIPLAVKIWWHTGIPTWHVVGGVVIQTLSFASLLVVGALATMAAENVAIPIIAPIGMLIFTQLLVNRQGLYADYIKSKLAQDAFDWLYYILPKCTELDGAASTFIQSSAIAASWPLWTTALFTLVTLTLTLRLLERKSF